MSFYWRKIFTWHTEYSRKDLGHSWLGNKRILGHLQLSAHLPNILMWGPGFNTDTLEHISNIGTQSIESDPHPSIEHYCWKGNYGNHFWNQIVQNCIFQKVWYGHARETVVPSCWQVNWNAKDILGSCCYALLGSPFPYESGLWVHSSMKAEPSKWLNCLLFRVEYNYALFHLLPFRLRLQKPASGSNSILCEFLVVCQWIIDQWIAKKIRSSHIKSLSLYLRWTMVIPCIFKCCACWSQGNLMLIPCVKRVIWC